VSIGGSRPNANYFLLDGATNTDPTFNTQNLSPNPDTVQEFQVETASYSAEMGGAGGGQINIATLSGTSAFHGTAYEFLRNGSLDAHSFNQMGGTNHLVQNDFGGSLGGPLSGKHTFFFVNYEGYRHVAADTMTDTVPTADEVSGDFSQSGITIYDPATTQPNATFNPNQPVSPSNPQSIRQPFPNNKIPASRISSVAGVMLQDYVPRPNQMSDVSMGMTMNGQPFVVGSGTDSNNYLDYAMSSTIPTRVLSASIMTSTKAAMRFYATVHKVSTALCRRIFPDSAISTITSHSRGCSAGAAFFRQRC
jgi:hypothetical protein